MCSIISSQSFSLMKTRTNTKDLYKHKYDWNKENE